MHTLRFDVITAPVTAEFTLAYDVGSLAIEAVPRPAHVGITLHLKYVQLYLSDDGDIIFVDGFLPLAREPRTFDTPPDAVAGRLRVLDLDEILTEGVTQAVGEQGDWSVSITEDRAWIALRRVAPLETSLRTVRFAEPCIAMLADEYLVGLWLKVDNLPAVLADDAMSYRRA